MGDFLTLNLGIAITENTGWGQHISEISPKANKIRRFLRKYLAFAPQGTKDAIKKVLARF